MCRSHHIISLHNFVKFGHPIFFCKTTVVFSFGFSAILQQRTNGEQRLYNGISRFFVLFSFKIAIAVNSTVRPYSIGY